jgi:Uma2 family endonuclease
MNAQPQPPNSAMLPVEQWRLPDHLDLPPGPIDTERVPWVWPDHTMLPCEDGIPANNAQEPPQDALLTDTLLPILAQIHPDGHYFIGQDVGIYWRLTDPLLRGCISPDWYFVPGVPPLIKGELRRSYVMWREEVPPLFAVEYVSGNGSEERDRTPETGKFCIYENRIRVTFYAIFNPAAPATLEFYHLVDRKLQLMPPNARGHYEIPQLSVELGIWEGTYQAITGSWLRWWDKQGHLLPSHEELAREATQRAELEKQRAEREKQLAEHAAQQAEQEKQRAEQEKQRADDEADKVRRLAEKLRSLGINPDEV